MLKVMALLITAALVAWVSRIADGRLWVGLVFAGAMLAVHVVLRLATGKWMDPI